MNKGTTHAWIAALVATAAAACGGTEAQTDRGDSGEMDLPDASTEDASASLDGTTDATKPIADAAIDAAHLDAGHDAGRDAGRDATADAMTDAGADASACANTQTDNANCGSCGHVCGSGTVCGNGTCGLTCGALTTCSPDGGTAYCANTGTDNANCGTCGHACGAGTVCSGGSCNTTCGGHLVDCGGACVDGRSDPDHCGATDDCAGGNTGVQCATGKSCVSGSCVCDNKTTCGGVGVDSTTDTNNCGGCGNVCQGLCVNGGCATSCASVLALSPAAPSGTYLVDPDGIGPGAAYGVYCDMTHNGGGWTLALKADGANPSTSFTYGSALWSNAATLNPGSVDLSMTEAKFLSFSQIVASSVLLVVADTTANASTP